MSRLHVHISVDDIAQNIRFYSALFGNKPSVEKTDYAKWDLSEPAVNFAISKRGVKQGLDHVGIQADSDGELAVIQSRLERAGIKGLNNAMLPAVTHARTSTGHRTRRVSPGRPSIHWTRFRPSMKAIKNLLQAIAVYRRLLHEIQASLTGTL